MKSEEIDRLEWLQSNNFKFNFYTERHLFTEENNLVKKFLQEYPQLNLYINTICNVEQSYTFQIRGNVGINEFELIQTALTEIDFLYELRFRGRSTKYKTSNEITIKFPSCRAEIVKFYKALKFLVNNFDVEFSNYDGSAIINKNTLEAEYFACGS